MFVNAEFHNLFNCGLGRRNRHGSRGVSAAAVISPMLIAFLNFEAYEAVGIALASDMLASAVSSYTYAKNKNIDIKNGLVMLFSTLVFTVIGSFLASLVPNSAMGGFSVVMTFILGLRFIFKPVMTEKDRVTSKTRRQAVIQSIICGCVIGSTAAL